MAVGVPSYLLRRITDKSAARERALAASSLWRQRSDERDFFDEDDHSTVALAAERRHRDSAADWLTAAVRALDDLLARIAADAGAHRRAERVDGKPDVEVHDVLPADLVGPKTPEVFHLVVPRLHE